MTHSNIDEQLSSEAWFRIIRDDKDANPEIGIYYRACSIGYGLPDFQIVLPTHPEHARATFKAVIRYFLDNHGGMPPDMPTIIRPPTLKLEYLTIHIQTDAGGTTKRDLCRYDETLQLQWVTLHGEQLLRIIFANPYCGLGSKDRFNPENNEFPFDQQYLNRDVK